MRTRGATGAADQADPVTGHHAAPARDVDPAEVRVPARHAEPVADDHELAVTVAEADRLDAAAPGGSDRRARRRRVVLARVEHRAARPEAVAGRDAQRR